MRRQRSIVLAIAGAAILGCAAAAAAQDASVEKIQEILAVREHWVQSWRTAGWVHLGLTLAVGGLGVFTTAFQRHRWAKRLAIALGVSVSLLTLVKTTIFKHDHHAFHTAYRRGMAHVEQAKVKLAKAARIPSESLDAFVEEIQKEIGAIDVIANALDAGEPNLTVALHSVSPDLGFGFATPAYAEASPGPPAWTREPPASDKVYVWVVARGQGRTLQEAREAAIADSGEILERTFLQQGTVSGTANANLTHYRSALLAAAIEETSHFDYDEGKQTFDYYRLLRLRRETIESSVRFSALAAREQVSQSTIQLIQQTRPSPEAITLPRASIERLLASTQQSLPAEDWRQFSDGRYARLTGNYGAAKASFEKLLAKHPDTYLAWFNLGLAYDKTGRPAEAENAYRRALALEKELPQRDAAIFNTLGFFLVRQNRAQDAIPLLERALELDPGYVKARNTLEAARERVKQP